MSLYDNGIRISTREADATLEYQQTNVCITRQMTEDEKARYGSMDGSGEKQTMANVPGMTTNHRGPKPRERRYCPSCQAEIKLREEQLKEPAIKCLKCAGNFETDLWGKTRKTQNQGDGGATSTTCIEEKELAPENAVTDPHKEIDAGWEEVAAAEHKAKHEAYLAEQAKAREVIPANLQIAHLVGEIIGLTNELKKEGYDEGFRNGYQKAQQDLFEAMKALGSESVMVGGR